MKHSNDNSQALIEPISQPGYGQSIFVPNARRRAMRAQISSSAVVQSISCRGARSKNRTSITARALLQIESGMQSAGAIRSQTKRLVQVSVDLRKKEQTSDERRSLPRHDGRSTISFHRLEKGRNNALQQADWLLHSTRNRGELIDLSLDAVSLVVQEKVEANENLLLRIRNSKFNKHVDTLASVISSKPIDNGRWKLVCRFSKRLRMEDIQLLGAHSFGSSLV